jgi:hypothetical protein
MNDTTLRSILNNVIACHHVGVGGFTADDTNAALEEILAIDARAARAVKDAERNELDRINREAGAVIVYALDDFARSLGFAQTDPSSRHKRLPFERHEIAHMSRDWFLVDVSRDGTRLRVSVRDEPTGRSVIQRVHDGVDLKTLAAEFSGNAFTL